MTPGRPAPALPRFVARPLALLPKAPARLLLQQALNFVFAEHLRSGEIDFLDQRCLNVSINDAGIEFALSLRHRKLAVRPAAAEPRAVRCGISKPELPKRACRVSESNDASSPNTVTSGSL